MKSIGIFGNRRKQLGTGKIIIIKGNKNYRNKKNYQCFIHYIQIYKNFNGEINIFFEFEEE
jgi:hypothetical protein